MNVFEVYVEKKPEFSGLEKTRVFSRYFIQGISQAEFEAAKLSVFSDPAVDFVYDKLPALDGARVLALELLPGQFDQRADSVAQCIFLLTGKEKPIVQTATIYAYYGNISEQEWKRIKSELINPVECREADLEKPKTLYQEYPKPDDVAVLDGFTGFSHNELIELLKKLNITMDLSDLIFCQNYFRDEEKRDPTITEIRLLDTYWSDHCRHTTFLTELDAQIEDEPLRESFDNYLEIKKTLDRDNHPVTLMDIATIGARALKAQGMLSDLDESDEINACSVKIKVDVDGVLQDWLLMFKNETHNHPTEIEPFGGASTCLGGAIRDPLSGRAYVYQAMRITGAADPLRSDTLPGKLPQRLICQKAAEGYSSYGNQIGVATGHVAEVYHDGYAAKRMELGAVIGAVPAENVVRELPTPGDVVILVGGRTGRDGIGGATGSSKTQGPTAMETFAAEVQKGNAPEERKIQRLFRNSKVSRLIKKCNDFGAGGVSVSVGELADGILINLDKVPVKYEGLDGTELAISESQERMSIVVSKENASLFIELANEENLEAVIIAEVTQEKRMVMNWRGKTIVNLSRDFLNSNGASKQAKAQITEPVFPQIKNKIADAASLEKLMGSLSYCSQKGLVQMFDSSAGGLTALAPLGGKYQLTPAQTMAAKLPLLNGITKTSSLMSWGFDPVISTISPYHGAIFAVVISAAKIIAAGGSRKRLWLSFQEYFEKLRDEPSRWGKPLAALLGALDAQLGLKIAAIGGKDSMSGSFTTADGKNIDVPPTLVSFAVSTANIDNLISPEFKRCGSYVYHFKSPFTVFEKPNFNKLNDYFDVIEKLITDGKILSAWAVGSGGTAEAIVKMCVGNRFGFDSEQELTAGNGFGGFILEAESQIDENRSELLGRTTSEYTLKTKTFTVSLEKIQETWERALEPIYPCNVKQNGNTELFISKAKTIQPATFRGKPKFVIPVIHGTNSEYDITRAIEKTGGEAQVIVIQTLTSQVFAQSIVEFNDALMSSQVLVLANGYSGTDDLDGCGNFISAFLENYAVSDTLNKFLEKQDNLVYGGGSGFQALLKLGLLPSGKLQKPHDSPALTTNKIARYQSSTVNLKITSNNSSWLSCYKPGECLSVPFAAYSGRFIATDEQVKELAANGQIAAQYVDFDGNASMDIRFNPAGSMYAIESIISPDGRIIGATTFRDLFKCAVEYFTG